MTNEVIWTPSKELIKKSKLTNFLKYCNQKDYNSLEAKATEDPGWLWDNVIKFSELEFYKPYTKILDDSDGPEWTKWCLNGKTNFVKNCIDRHKDKNFNKISFSI